MTGNESIEHDIEQSLSLRKPQADSLAMLAKVAKALADNISEDKLAAIQKICPSITSFDRDFPSLCFALATGVGKTRLMGAIIDRKSVV